MCGTHRFPRLPPPGHDNVEKLEAGRTRYAKPNAVYSLYCTPRDYATFIIEMMNPDRSAAHSLTADSLRTMFTRAPVR